MLLFSCSGLPKKGRNRRIRFQTANPLFSILILLKKENYKGRVNERP